MDQERDERGLVDISPAEVIAAGHVIEFVAEVAIAVVEVKMQQEVREGKQKYNDHAVREERPLLIVQGGRVVSGNFHWVSCRYARVLKRFLSFNSFKEACRR